MAPTVIVVSSLTAHSAWKLTSSKAPRENCTSCGPIELDDALCVEVRSAIAEKAPVSPITGDQIEIECVHEHAFVLCCKIFGKFAAMIGDEGMAIEFLLRTVVVLEPDTVCGDDRHRVCDGMALHDALPLQMRIEPSVIGLRSDSRRIEQYLGALQDHRACTFRIPLIPTDADADATVLRRPGLEPGVARPEVVFLLITGAIGNVALAINAEDFSIHVSNCDAVIEAGAVLLEERDRDDHAELRRQLFECEHARMLVHRIRGFEPFRILSRAKVNALEELRG